MEKQIEETKESFDVWLCQNDNFPDGIIPERYYFTEEELAKEFCLKNSEFKSQKVIVLGFEECPTSIGELIFFSFGDDKTGKAQLSVHLFKDTIGILEFLNSSFNWKPSELRNFKSWVKERGALSFHDDMGFTLLLEHKIQSTTELSNFESDLDWVREKETYRAYQYFYVKPKYFELIKERLGFDRTYFNWKYQINEKSSEDSIGEKFIDKDIWVCYGIYHHEAFDQYGVYDFYFDKEEIAKKFLNKYSKMTMIKCHFLSQLDSPKKIVRILYQNYKGELVIGLKSSMKELMNEYQEDVNKCLALNNEQFIDPYVNIYDKEFLKYPLSSGGKYFKFLKIGGAHVHKTYKFRNHDTRLCDSHFVEEKITPELEKPDQKVIIWPLGKSKIKKGSIKEKYRKVYGEAINKEIEIFINTYCDKNNKEKIPFKMIKYQNLVLEYILERKGAKFVAESVENSLHDRIKIDFEKSN